jgi:ATP-dependent RNA circularization protein (DNA/RNA ligase family)
MDMIEYPKINTIWKRDMTNKGRIIDWDWACPEFEYLANNQWLFTEKVDGTNIRIHWLAGHGTRIGGRTEDAQIPTFLYDKIQDILPAEKFEKSIDKASELILFGEGYGARIQKGGGNYIPNGASFVLFDVLVDKWWLERSDVEDVAKKLGIEVVPIIGSGGLPDAAQRAKEGFESHWGPFTAEGIVMRSQVDLFNRKGERILAKIKHKDYEMK